MAAWVTISAITSTGGTLVLAGVTVASLRSANRAALINDTGLYLAMSIRNIGTGIAVLHGWYAYPHVERNIDRPQPRER